ncbi:hypothetical protein AB1L88_20445 [Tautonia sp. JC769]|uniref:hypothetical protein n=1 Tax=Tautonia sp. JC769 TaxID=3232135 RepID=UPI0034575A64
MIHTEQIIGRSIDIWSEWLGQRVLDIEAHVPQGVDELYEIQVGLSPSNRRYFIGWQQEDGPSDETLFYWLSMQHHSHFLADLPRAGSLAPPLKTILDKTILAVELYGWKALDAVVAVIIQCPGSTIGIATTRYLLNKRNLSRLGIQELAVVEEDQLRAELLRQDIEKVADLR